MRRPWILPAIIFSQFTGTSLWFAGNAVIGDLQLAMGLDAGMVGWITSSVQLGFISGALCFAWFSLADRYSPRLIFLFCSLFGAAANLSIFLAEGAISLIILRFVTGFFLAGIYPVGMKAAAAWYDRGLGRAIGYLVGALVLGTAFPHLVKSLGHSLPWQVVMSVISILAALGGVLLYLLVPDGPHLPKAMKFNPRSLVHMFGSPKFRAASFGYFGHMWELYAFWAFTPFFIRSYAENRGLENLDVSMWSFAIIAIGFLGCAVGGLLSGKWGSARVAQIQLAASGCSCLISPLFFEAPPLLFFGALLVWGITVIGDSPQFSALTAQTAPRDVVGSALTIVTCIGFAITIFSIQLLDLFSKNMDARYLFLVLLAGPLFGLRAMKRLL